MVVILTVASVSSQTILPIQTKYEGKNAVIISEAQMDSINILYLKHGLLKAEKVSFEFQLAQSKLRMDAFFLQINSLENANATYKSVISNKERQTDLMLQKHALEIEYYKKKSKNKWVPYVIGFVAGGIASIVF